MEIFVFLFVVIVFVYLVKALAKTAKNRSMQRFDAYSPPIKAPLQRPSAAKPLPLPYRAAPLVSPAERSFLGVLDMVVPDGYRIFTKVRLGDVITTKEGLDNSQRQIYWNKVDRKHLDFVICRADDLTTICAIELDDASHKMCTRQERDKFVDAALQAATIPCFHFPAKNGYKTHEIADQFAGAMPELKLQAPVPDTVLSQPSATDAPSCPSCGQEMVLRTAKRGQNTGNSFWGCPEYPKCRGILQS